MQKPATYGSQGFVIEKFNIILSQILQKYRNSELSNYSNRQLTESVEILENSGYTAIFMLAYYQKEAA